MTNVEKFNSYPIRLGWCKTTIFCRFLRRSSESPETSVGRMFTPAYNFLSSAHTFSPASVTEMTCQVYKKNIESKRNGSRSGRQYRKAQYETKYLDARSWESLKFVLHQTGAQQCNQTSYYYVST